MSEWKEMQDRVGKYRRDHGFFTPSFFDLEVSGITGADILLGKLALVSSEIGEAVEAVRDHDEENLVEELADTVIRIMDICDALELDLWSALRTKMDVNEGRPRLHGRKTNI